MGVKILLKEKEKKQTFSGTLSNTSVLTIGETISFFDIWAKLCLGSSRFEGPRKRICNTILSHPAQVTDSDHLHVHPFKLLQKDRIQGHQIAEGYE